ncbi:hypothetical protein ACO0OE_000480 [Hanseniaspora uvarum]
MSTDEFDLWDLLINNYIKQDDLISSVIYLNKRINSICEKKLYKNLKFTCNPYRNYKKQEATYVYGFKNTIINGFSKKGDFLNKKDQSDHILYSKLLNLLHTANINKINQYTESIEIKDDCFYYKENNEIFLDLMNKFNDKKNKSLINFNMDMDSSVYNTIFEASLIKKNNLENLRNLNINSILQFELISKHLSQQLETLTLKNIYEKVSLENFTNLKNLIILDTTTLFNCTVPKVNEIKKLNIDFLHTNQTEYILHLNNKEIDLLKNLAWEKITDLSFNYNCLLQEEKQCECIDYFILSFGYFERLTNLQNLTLSQSLQNKESKTQKFDMNSLPILHYWDDTLVNIFMLLPTLTISKRLNLLRLKLYPSMNGHAKNISDGYYTMRLKKMYHLKEILDHNCKLLSVSTEENYQALGSLKILDIPQFLQSLIQIPILSNDLLWNGCQCAICRPTLEHIDKYMHDHLWFRKNISNSGGFGSGVSNKFQELENGEMFSFMTLPIDKYCEDFDSIIDGNGLDYCWDFHEDLYNGNDLKLIHYSDDQHRNHKCDVNDLQYGKIVLQTFEHFIDLYLDHFLFNLPNLNLLVLSGFAYRIDMKSYGSFILSDIYDDN